MVSSNLKTFYVMVAVCTDVNTYKNFKTCNYVNYVQACI